MSSPEIEYRSVPGFSIAQTKLLPPEVELENMIEFMQNLQDKSENSNKQFWDQKGGLAHLHQLHQFNWLTVEIEKIVVRYLSDLGYDSSRIALFHQKSWPVITRKDSSIKRHAHFNSILAAVFYLRCDPESGGNLDHNEDKTQLLG